MALQSAFSALSLPPSPSTFSQWPEVFFELDFLLKQHFLRLFVVASIGAVGIDKFFNFFFVAVLAVGHPVVIVFPEHWDFLGNLDDDCFYLPSQLLLGDQEDFSIIL